MSRELGHGAEVRARTRSHGTTQESRHGPGIRTWPRSQDVAKESGHCSGYYRWRGAGGFSRLVHWPPSIDTKQLSSGFSLP